LRFPQPGHNIQPILNIEPTVSLTANKISGGATIPGGRTRGYAGLKTNAAAGKTRRAIL
jgi:hypothetical protein